MGHGTWDMGRFEAAGKMVVNMIYGTFQCKLWHFLAQTMAVCAFVKKVQYEVKIIDKTFCHVRKSSYLCRAKAKVVRKSDK